MKNKIQIIHICEDEKFIKLAIAQFEDCFLGCNKFLVLVENTTLPLKFIDESNVVKKVDLKELNSIAKNLEDNVVVVLHSLSINFFEFILNLALDIKIIWFCIGYEVYNDPNLFNEVVLLDKITKERFKKNSSFKNQFKEKLLPIYRLIKRKLPLSNREKKKFVIKRIDYLGSSYKEDYSLISKLIKQEKKFFSFWYYPIELILDINNKINKPKENILIGNSGFKTGNHLDVFNKIQNYNFKNKIIVPLNYGDNQYIEMVCNEGKTILGDKFQPLLMFMPLQEYNKILAEIGVAIFNNRRQQAVGNTIALIWFGTKVFLSKHNTFYHYLKRIGVHVYCYETELNETNCNQLLSFEQIENNRKILFKELNKEHLTNLLKKQILKIYE